jgi:hypothetical protein
VFLAWSPPDAVAAWLARGSLGPAAADQMHRPLERVRERATRSGCGTVGRKVDDVIALLARSPLDETLRAELTALLSRRRDEHAVLDAEPDRSYSVCSLIAPVCDAAGEVALAVTMDCCRRS